MSKRNYQRGANRPHSPGIIVMQEAADEVDAYYAAKRVESRAQREKQEKHLQELWKKITLPVFSWSNKPGANDNGRSEAERRAIERIRLAVHSLQLSLTELARIPNPDSEFVNEIDQRALSNLLPQLRRCVHPPIAPQ